MLLKNLFSILLLSSTSLALSPHDDILHYPSYKVLLSSQVLKNEQVEDRVVIPTKTRTWACKLPEIDQEALNLPSEIAPSAPPTVETAMDLLASLPCLYHVQGWFTYEFCHLSHARQFHKRNGPDDNSQELDYSLGNYQEVQVMQIRTGSDGRKYLTQRFEGGTTCDLTGKPRGVEVQFHCPLVPSLDHIALVQETSTCSYLMIINTLRLCKDSRFNPPTKKVHPIVCSVVVSDAYYDLHHASKLNRNELLNAVSDTPALDPAYSEPAPEHVTPFEAAKMEAGAKATTIGNLAQQTIEIKLDDFSLDPSKLSKLLERVKVELEHQGVQIEAEKIEKPLESLADLVKKKLHDAQEEHRQQVEEERKAKAQAIRNQNLDQDTMVVVDQQGGAQVLEKKEEQPVHVEFEMQFGADHSNIVVQGERKEEHSTDSLSSSESISIEVTSESVEEGEEKKED